MSRAEELLEISVHERILKSTRKLPDVIFISLQGGTAELRHGGPQ
jgi:hypothetical protein